VGILADAPSNWQAQTPTKVLERELSASSTVIVIVATERGGVYNATIMVAIRLEGLMPTTITLKNIPDDVYERLKAAASAHRRSLNSEAILCLERMLTPTKVSPAERLERARRLRDELKGMEFRADEIDAMKREGRP
jgi:plasmid stability protein